MNFLIFLILVVAVFTMILKLVGYNVGIILPFLIGSAVIVAIIKLISIYRKNNY